MKDEYKNCREGRHNPRDFEMQEAGISGLIITATCNTCNANLEALVHVEEFFATYDSENRCPDCEEGKPWCECTNE